MIQSIFNLAIQYYVNDNLTECISSSWVVCQCILLEKSIVGWLKITLIFTCNDLIGISGSLVYLAVFKVECISARIIYRVLCIVNCSKWTRKVFSVK